MEPEKFNFPPSDKEREIHGNAILFGYQNMDRLLGRFLELEDDGTLLVLATALSQQPYLKYESIGGHRFYRLKAVSDFFDMLGLNPTSIYPTMTHQYLAKFNSAEERDAAAACLGKVRIDEKVVFQIGNDENDSLYFGCQIRTVVEEGTAILLPEHGLSSDVMFYDMFYELEGIKSGCHHPEGALWLKTGLNKLHKEKISILDIAPTILDYFNVDFQLNPNCPAKSKSLISSPSSSQPR